MWLLVSDLTHESKVQVVMTQMLETVIRLRVLLQLSINSLAQLSLGLSGPQQDSLSLSYTHTHSQHCRPPHRVSSPSRWLPWWGKRGLDGREERRQWGCDTTMAGSDFRSIQISAKHTTPKRRANKHPRWRDKHVTQTEPNIRFMLQKPLKRAASLTICYRVMWWVCGLQFNYAKQYTHTIIYCNHESKMVQPQRIAAILKPLWSIALYCKCADW